MTAEEQFFDVFISYGRADGKTLASKICHHLSEQNIKVWFDQNDIPPAVDWRNQISHGIERAHNLLFIVTPYSVQSPYCLQELETAYNLNKRIIPLLHIRVPRDRRPEAIGKLNWIYFQSGKDDFNRSFNLLLASIRQHQVYVKQHTRLLKQAYTWVRNQKQNSYLLVGKERSSAEAWLRRRFTDTQAPCLPTDLHCEFISESTKNANNLMSDVFLSYASEDREVMERIRRILLRQGFTIWTDKTDINSGSQFATEIQNGIEGADNLVYFLSNSAVNSVYCQQELTYAHSLHKRIIPLQIEKVREDLVPVELQGLQHIALPSYSNTEQFLARSDRLLKVLHQDAYYHREHKKLLVKALKWKKQNENASILLRGHNLNHFQDWLDLARKHSNCHPISVQTEYVRVSQQQPVQSSLEVFISYSRSDSDFVRKLNDALQIQGKTTWFDQESIPAGSDFQQELYKGIRESYNFLFVISPQSIYSPYCHDEVEYALNQNKRIVTIVYRPVPAKDLHPALAGIQWIDFNNHRGDFYANFSELVRTLDTDREYVRQHTTWALRAKEWSDKHQSSDLLLRGSEFALAEQWLQTANREQKTPPVTDLQKEYVLASQQAITAIARREKKRLWILRGLLTVVSSALLVSISLGIYARKQYRQAQVGQIRSMSEHSNAMILLGNRLDALLEAIRAKRLQQNLGKIPAKIQAQVNSTLRLAVLTTQESNRFLGHGNQIYTVAYSPKGNLIASGSIDNTIKIWQTTGELQATLKGHNNIIIEIAFSPDGQKIVSASEDGTLKIWDLQGNVQKTIAGNGSILWGLALSPDGQKIAAASQDGTVKVWNIDGTLISTLIGHSGSVREVAFSPDNRTLASVGQDKTVKIWNVDGTLLSTFKEHTEEVWSVSFSPDGKTVASAGEDGIICLWDLKGKVIQRLTGHRGAVWEVVFSPDGQKLSSVGSDELVRLWSKEGTQLDAFAGHRSEVFAVAFNPDGNDIISGGADRTIRLWQLDRNFLESIEAHQRNITRIAFSPDGKMIASGAEDRLVKLWKLDGDAIATLEKHGGLPIDLNISPDGQTLVTASADSQLRLWNLNGELKKTLNAHTNTPTAIAISPDGQTIVSAGVDKRLKIWNINGTLKTTITEDEDTISALNFSDDGTKLISGTFNGQIRFHSLEGKILQTIDAHQGRINRIAVSRKTIASASTDETVKLWNMNGTLKTTFNHQGEVKAVAFSPIDNSIATASRALSIWNEKSNLLASVNLTAPINDLTFSPDGKSLVFAIRGQLGVVRDLRQLIDIQHVLGFSCELVRDYLTTNPKLSESDRLLCDGIEKSN